MLQGMKHFVQIEQSAKQAAIHKEILEFKDGYQDTTGREWY